MSRRPLRIFWTAALTVLAAASINLAQRQTAPGPISPKPAAGAITPVRRQVSTTTTRYQRHADARRRTQRAGHPVLRPLSQ